MKKRTLINVKHDLCPPQKISPDNIVVSLIPNQLHGTYTFLCANCNYLITKPATPNLLDRLIDDAKAPYTVEPSHPSQLTTRDLQEFNLHLYGA